MEIEEYFTAFDLDRIGFQILAGRRPFGFARREIKTPVVFRTLNDVAEDQSIREMNLPMGCLLYTSRCV